MRECAECHTKSDDHVVICPQCGTDLKLDSVTARALREIIKNPRAQAVYVVARARACPACRRAQGTYNKNASNIPRLPIVGCSCPGGCTCWYEPLITEVGP